MYYDLYGAGRMDGCERCSGISVFRSNIRKKYRVRSAIYESVKTDTIEENRSEPSRTERDGTGWNGTGRNGTERNGTQ